MADFRRWILALAMLVLVVGFAVPASAQNHNINCNASAVPPALRHEGLNELTGDILLACVAATNSVPNATGTVPQTNITVNLTAPWTSRQYATANNGATVTEALLLVDDPPAGNQRVCGNPGNGLLCPDAANSGVSYGLANNVTNYPNGAPYNVFQGVVLPNSPPNVVTFLGVPVDPPATNATRYYRITNLRVNASTVAATSLGGSIVYGYVSASSSTSMEINAPQQVIGLVSNGLTVTVTSGGSFLQCVPETGVSVGTINFTDNFATAFKITGAATQNTPGVVYNTEGGLVIPACSDTVTSNCSDFGETGYSDTGTELQAVFASIPAGVTVAVENTVTSLTGTTATLVSPTPSASGWTVINPSGATGGTAVWEITVSNTQAIASLTFGIEGTWKSVPGTPGSPATGTWATVLGSYSPLVAAWANGPIPEFSTTVNVPTAPSNLFIINLCQTVLLFPYVTDYTGFDTGIAISNTGLDPLGATGASPGQNGSCVVSVYDNGALASNISQTGNPTAGTISSVYDTALTNGLIAAGSTWAFALSSNDPSYGSTPTWGTIGYAIGVCNFQFAHGYSFVSDYGIRNFAAAYVALIIPDTLRLPSPFTEAGEPLAPHLNNGEQLAH